MKPKCEKVTDVAFLAIINMVDCRQVKSPHTDECYNYVSTDGRGLVGFKVFNTVKREWYYFLNKNFQMT